MKSKQTGNQIIGIVLVGIFLVMTFFAGVFFEAHKHMTIEEEREEFISLKEGVITELIADGKYKCCLEKPCSYCIEKTPGHGEGAICNCLKDVVEGKHPCGECIGEILEGHGNPYLAEYFSRAISEEVGEQHADTIKQIISEKYRISIEEQL